MRILREIKWFCQRLYRGFDDTELMKKDITVLNNHGTKEDGVTHESTNRRNF